MSDVPIGSGTPQHSQQNLLEFQQDTEAETSAERQRNEDRAEEDRQEMHDMDQPITGPMETLSPPAIKPAKPSSPPRNPNRMIAPDTPYSQGIEGLTASRRSRRVVEKNEQTPDVEDEVPTKGPLRVRKDTIAAKKKGQSPSPDPPTRRSRPPPGALKETPVSSTPPRSFSEPSDETESDTQKRGRSRRRSKPGNAVSSDSSEGDDEKRAFVLTRRQNESAKQKINQFEYEKFGTKHQTNPGSLRVPDRQVQEVQRDLKNTSIENVRKPTHPIS